MAIEIPELREFDEERRHLTGPVLIPNRADLHGDIFTVNEVMSSCHYYNKNHFGHTDINHEYSVECCSIIESYLLPVPIVLGGIELPEGSWIAVLEVDKTNVGDVIWEMLHTEDLDGFSPQGPMYENKIVKD